MSTFVQDSFTDSDATNLSSHTGETGATWAKLTGFSGNVVINSNRAENAATFSVDAAYYASGAPTGADYDVSADYSWVNTNTCSWQILGRVDTSTGDFYTAYYRRGSNTFRIEKRVSGSYTTLASGTGDSPAAGTAVNIKLALSGSALELFADSVSKLTATDSSITAAGKVGVGVTSGGTSGPRVRWDNFLATEAGGAATLSPDNGSHGHSAGNITLGQSHALSIGNAAHSHAAQNAVLSVLGTLDIAHGTHGHVADNLTLAQHSEIIVAAAAHGHAVDTAALSQVHLLSVLSALHEHTASLAVLAAEGMLAPAPRRLNPQPQSTITASARTTTMTAASNGRSLTPER